MPLPDGMIVVIGHGPSIVGRKLGSFIDRSVVIRLKQAPMPDPEDWGTRTDYVSTTKSMYCKDKLPCEYWMFGPSEPGYRHADTDRWLQYFREFSHKKPSNGLCACMCAIEFLQPARIGLIGFDSIMHPENKNTGKWHNVKHGRWAHDQVAEHAALHSLRVKVVDLCS